MDREGHLDFVTELLVVMQKVKSSAINDSQYLKRIPEVILNMIQSLLQRFGRQFVELLWLNLFLVSTRVLLKLIFCNSNKQYFL